MGCSDAWKIDPDGAGTTWDDKTTIWDEYTVVITTWDLLTHEWTVTCDE